MIAIRSFTLCILSNAICYFRYICSSLCGFSADVTLITIFFLFASSMILWSGSILKAYLTDWESRTLKL